ncbi:MAG: hypothetical protein EXR27_22830 [Betaproteobacteria bacterium]|nr:hypothetical protein [Betaproteobacteria bacterium]
MKHRDHSSTRIIVRPSDHRSIYDSNYTHEVPLVIETDLHFPGPQKLLINFDGVTFLWINGDVDHFPLIVVPLASQLDYVRRLNDGYDVLARDRIGLVNRFLTALVCRYHIQARIHRSSYRAIVDKGKGETLALIERAGLPFEGDVNEIDVRSPYSEVLQFALGLYREGINSMSREFKFEVQL